MDKEELVDDDQLLKELEEMKATEKGHPGGVIPAEEMKFDDGKSSITVYPITDADAINEASKKVRRAPTKKLNST